jgi:hypothetical protein
MYIEMERRFGCIQKCRSLFKRAANTTHDGTHIYREFKNTHNFDVLLLDPEKIFLYWNQFEGIFGTLETEREAQKRFDYEGERVGKEMRAEILKYKRHLKLS